MRWLALLLGITISGGVFQPVQMGEPAAGGAQSVSVTITASRTIFSFPGHVHAKVAITPSGFTRTVDAQQECQVVWDWGDTRTSGTSAYERGSADETFFATRNKSGFSDAAAHLYEKDLADWDETDPADSVTVTATVKCMDSDGTIATGSDTETLTITDPLAAAGTGCDEAVWLRPFGSSESGKPTCVSDSVALASGDDLCGEIATQEGLGFTTILVQDAATGTYKCDTSGVTVDSKVIVASGDRETDITENGFSGSDNFFILGSSNVVVSGLKAITTDSPNDYHAYQYSSGVQHPGVYRGGGSGVGSCTRWSGTPTIQGLGFFRNDCEMGSTTGQTGNAQLFFNSEHGTHAFVDNLFDMNGKLEFAVRLSCFSNKSWFAHNDVKDSHPDKNDLAVRDSCATPDNDYTRLSWNRVIHTNPGSAATFMGQYQPQDTTSPNERQEFGIMEGNLFFTDTDVDGACSGSNGSPARAINMSGRHHTFRHNAFVAQNGCDADSNSVRLIFTTFNVDNCPTKVVPDYDPPAGCDNIQYGDIAVFSNVIVNEESRSSGGGYQNSFCDNTDPGTADDDIDCGPVFNNLTVNEIHTGTPTWFDSWDGGNGGGNVGVAGSATAGETAAYFGTYTKATAWTDLTVNDFRTATPPAGVCDPRMFWEPDGTTHPTSSCKAGLYQD